MKPQENDIPAPRTIRIGSASVGLIGLDPAMGRALAEQLPEAAAVDFLFTAISRQNYIPAQTEALYREALRREYRNRLGLLPADREKTLTIRVLGSGCVTCNALSAMLFEVLQKLKLTADMESVHDPDEMGRYGAPRTPALIINGRIRCAGRMPTPAEIEAWVGEEADRIGTESFSSPSPESSVL